MPTPTITTFRDTFSLEDLKILWKELGDIPTADPAVDPEEGIEEAFHIFPVGTPKMNLWHWFDDRCQNGLAVDLQNQKA